MSSTDQPARVEYATGELRRRRWPRKWTFALAGGVALVLYVAAYHVALNHRIPWANLRYFSWSEDDRTDRILYWVYWPAYAIHRWWEPDSAIHWSDRRKPKFDVVEAP